MPPTNNASKPCAAYGGRRSSNADKRLKMKTKLIDALRLAASALEAGRFYYDWNEPSCCNCGALFCALTGKSAAELHAEVPEGISEDLPHTWEGLLGQYCPMSGLPTQKLFLELFSYGLTQEDVANLEYLRDDKVLARMNLSETVLERMLVKWPWYLLRKPKLIVKEKSICVKPDHKNKEHVIAYMRAWADLLSEQAR